MSHTQSILAEVSQYVSRQMAQNDAAHDGDHVRRVVAIALSLCKTYPQADPFRTELLAWLHDMNDDKLNSDVGPAAIQRFLQSTAVPEADIQFVLNGIGYISYRKHPKLPPNTPLEIQIVQDADRIDAMGAIGIARTFAYGGANNRALADSLCHFDEKLLLLYDLLNTEEAKRIAKPRYEFLKSFYAQYLAENSLTESFDFRG